jgi:thioesterase-3
VILAVDLQFKRELHNREKIVITTQAVSYTGKIGKLLQVIKNEKGEDACTALFTFGLFDLKARKLIPPTPEWLKAIGAQTP